MDDLIKNDWYEVLGEEFQKPYFLKLQEFLQKEFETATIFPSQNTIFQALNTTAYNDVKVVILGQDPYHGEGQAHGLSFSVQPGVKHPPSLRNLFLELDEDQGCAIPKDGTLSKWAEQGVLLLNTVLTVRKGEANSHKGRGWELFTDKMISSLNDRKDPLVFVLWGKHAQQKKSLIDKDRHLVIESAHPSPFSARRGFFGSKPFSKANQFLKEQQHDEIDWCL
ncbi:uracil-DNA glycosylase [Metabacillus herbersteinensis]|uniref:Uracil-DNA glycosylase n=1 Tax=Metabacillus herbersteinensis TaxID=283816 RepID=A0ABV6GFE7_9BACI